MQPEQQDYWRNAQNQPHSQPNVIPNQSSYQMPVQNTSQTYIPNVQPQTNQSQVVNAMQNTNFPSQNTESNITQPVNQDNQIHWSAKEYIYREKNRQWFMLFAIVVVAFIAADFLLIKSYTFSVLVVVMAISIIVYSSRPPRAVNYTLSDKYGLYVGEKLYNFSEFKAFGLLQEDEHNSIILIPVKRFAPGVSVYFPKELGEVIVDTLGARLPMEAIKLDFMDEIVRKLHL